MINGVDLGAQSNDVSATILIDLTQRETMNASSRFADHASQRELTDSRRCSFKTTYHRFAGLAVLKAPDVPAVLLESGYITDPGDLKTALLKATTSTSVAIGVTHAVEAHFARRLDGPTWRRRVTDSIRSS